MSAPVCSPLCGASKAYGRFDKPWKHEPQCPVRLQYEQQKKRDIGRAASGGSPRA